ncbi:MAG TPA: aldo/keto reductase [Bradyrhizobium sp.]|nr:aldo/keto reductase [Bradyrhizobium sp.]
MDVILPRRCPRSLDRCAEPAGRAHPEILQRQSIGFSPPEGRPLSTSLGSFLLVQGTKMIFRNLKSGRIPALGLGTWELEGDECVNAVERALEIGYRHIDTAVRYGNEVNVGRGVLRSGLPRDSLFITTKVWHDSLQYDQVLRSLESSLDRLGMDYVDLFLVHWPNPSVPLEATMSAMAELLERGWARNIGVSNFTIALLRKTCEELRIPISANQFEMHPFLDQDQLLGEVRRHGLVAEAYQPLAGGKVLSSPELTAIAKRYGRSPAQIVLRWLLQKDDVVAIPRSRNPANIASNFDVFSFELEEDDCRQIEALRGRTRYVNPSFAPQWD